MAPITIWIACPKRCCWRGVKAEDESGPSIERATRIAFSRPGEENREEFDGRQDELLGWLTAQSRQSRVVSPGIIVSAPPADLV